MNKLLISAAVLAMVFSGCKKGTDPQPEDNELITTVELTFTGPTQTKQVFTWKDMDGDGGKAPVISPVSLAPNTTYTLTTRFLDESGATAKDMTVEIREEADEHLVVYSPMPATLLTYTATDKDSRNFPIGLSGSAKSAGAGTGTLVVQLRHQPPVSGKAIKNGTAAPGSDDVRVEFPLTIK